ncbi:hypothetical protein D3C80_2021160 [compost metagenome]
MLYLGGDTPAEGVCSMLKHKKADMLCLSLSDPNRLNDGLNYIAAIRREVPLIKLVLGGRGFEQLPEAHPLRASIIGDQIDSWERWYREQTGVKVQ